MGASPSSPTKEEEEPCERRIRKELHRVWVDPPAFCRPGASPVTDLLHWEVVIDGPAGSPYAGGAFPVDVHFTGDHPYKPPKITFKTKVYHPNIDSEGRMVLNIFQKKWSPVLTIEKLLLSIVSVLYDPMLNRPINGHSARQYKRDVKLYERTARAWTRSYASTPVASCQIPHFSEFYRVALANLEVVTFCHKPHPS
ncbi:ubiquitin-conjugating enzyme E2 11-like [Panicum hallii]|uniref:ubiquitin-conjugating enzyme E2 11-like n=1 Tax=Panicum hallii TaxID=206008 RepID=UPI000DF4D693|nr:ubiquitin-conjugating enzyme E2 11-like [Panicum hallii]